MLMHVAPPEFPRPPCLECTISWRQQSSTSREIPPASGIKHATDNGSQQEERRRSECERGEGDGGESEGPRIFNEGSACLKSSMVREVYVVVHMRCA